MNCLKIFYPLQKYSSVTLYPASSLGAASEVYSHFLLFRLRGSLTVNRCAIMSWNSPMTWPMQRLITWVFEPKRSTTWTMALNENPDTRRAASSLMRILVNLRLAACALSRWRNHWFGGNKSKVLGSGVNLKRYISR